MKKLFLILYTLLAGHLAGAQTDAKVSGRFLNYTYPTITFHILRQGENTSPRNSFQTVRVKKDGSFSLKASGMKEPFQISFGAPIIGNTTLFFADGYDLHLAADASSRAAFRQSLSISGQGSGVNSFWLKLNAYRQAHSDTVNWYKKDEETYLKHFTDSIHEMSALIAAIGETDNDSRKEFFKKTLLNDHNIRSARSLYTYSFRHKYTYDQTQGLLKKAGLPDARDYLGEFQYEKFFVPQLPSLIEAEEKDPVTGLVHFGSISMQKDKFYQAGFPGIIRVRVEPVIREDADRNPGFGQPIVERNGKRIAGDAYTGLDVRSGAQSGPSYVIDGKNSIELAGNGITEGNAANYLYRVVQNGIQDLISWRKPSEFRTTTDGKVRYAYFGKFSYKENQVLTLEIVNVRDPSVRDMFLMDWRAVKKPVIDFDINYITPGRAMKQGSGRIMTRSLQGSLSGYFTPSFLVAAPPDIRFRLADSLQSLSFTLKNNPETYEYYITLKQKTPKAETVSSLGKTNTRFVLDKFYWDQPGEYEVIFTPRLFNMGGTPSKEFKAQAETIRFTVMPPLNPPSVFSVRQLILILSIFFLAAVLVFYFFRRKQKKNVSDERQQKELATLQLRSVRSQLNPHFMFNALAGIQNLMNRNEPDAANLYLSKFARITRSVLEENEKDLTTISSEIALLGDYLEMEKMRFGFQYAFEMDDRIDQDNTEIPSMLLQPFVENAVKHGIAGLEKNGLITIRFHIRGKDLILQVQDNGSGKKIDADGKGRGIKLSENRIKLYNRLYRESAISLKIDQNKEGTLITLELKDWI